MEFGNLEEIIEFAIEKEKEAAEFYEMLSGRESMAGVREMLLEFAGQERKHQEMLEDIKKGEVEETVENYDFKWITDLKRSDYVVDMTYQEDMGYRDILLIAMKREEKALALYNQLQDNARTRKEKDVFKLLCQEEAKHKLGLETVYDDYMADMGD